MPQSEFTLQLGVKTDPIEYRYSFEWLFRLLAEEGVSQIQLGTWFELYRLPDRYFERLRVTAADFGLQFSSVFTSHRELGGCFIENSDWHEIAAQSYRRLIEIGALIGARSVGCNPGAVLRDRMDGKSDGSRRYLDHMKQMMRYARECRLQALCIEPMSCAAEPPTLPGEIAAYAMELAREHESHPMATVPVGYCADISHGYCDEDRRVVFDNYELLEPCLPALQELHLRNTDRYFEKTFGFTPAERDAGIVDVGQLRRYLIANNSPIPNRDLVGYFEIGGPKLGRDYSDHDLDSSLRQSLRYLKTAFLGDEPPEAPALAPRAVKIAPSMMCADICALEDDLRRLEKAGVDILHFDIMDAHFVPNMPMGLTVVEQLRKKTKLPFDVHLMVEDNAFFIQRLLEIGVESISIHAESAVHLDRLLASIRSAGVKSGVALNPATPLDVLTYVAEQLDFVLLMTVNPGFAGQSLVPSALRKIEDCRTLLCELGSDATIEVDGNVSFELIPKMVAAGADILVAGTSSVFRAEGSLRDRMARTDGCIVEGLRARAEARAGASKGRRS